MLKRLELTYFRKHHNLVVDFSQGLHAIRGANEDGKSTIIEGVLYVLFGARSLRTPLADTVTWGQPESALKVVLHYDDYTFTRSSRGAEVVKDGKVFVTGQNEVTSFSASLIGADAATASKLMLANQGNLRGSLEAGPKATAEMIESLADFDLFDRLIEAMQSKLFLGSPTLLEDAWNRAQVQLNNYVLPVVPSEDAMKTRVEVERNKVLKLKCDLVAAQKAEAEAQAHLDTLRQQAADVIRTLEDIDRAEQALIQHTEAKVKAEAESSGGPSDRELSELRQRVTDAENAEERARAWNLFKDYVPGTRWNGDIDSFKAKVQEVSDQLEVQRKEGSRLEEAIQAGKRSLVTGDTCKACGQRLPDAEAIASSNAKIQRVIDDDTQALDSLRSVIAITTAHRNNLYEILNEATKVAELINKLGTSVTLDHSHYPPALTWKGAPVLAAPDISGAKKALEGAEARQKVCMQAAARAIAMGEAMAEDQRQIDTLRAKELPDVDSAKVDAASQKVSGLRVQMSALNLEISTTETIIRMEEQAYKEAVVFYERAVKEQDKLVQQANESKAALESLHFNNALLKKIREARPIVADKLWGMVLAAVSTMFSTMRGEKSVVTKSKDGFAVNGQAVGSLSGSTLDLLGLSIRIALVKTFLPACPFLVLDEPAAAMDGSRTAQMLGFITSAGFSQTILVTHEDLSELMADRLTQL